MPMERGQHENSMYKSGTRRKAGEDSERAPLRVSSLITAHTPHYISVLRAQHLCVKPLPSGIGIANEEMREGKARQGREA